MAHGITHSIYSMLLKMYMDLCWYNRDEIWLVPHIAQDGFKESHYELFNNLYFYLLLIFYF